MPKPKKLWEVWEKDVNEALGLRGTISSGSKWYDIADGQTPEGHPIPVMVDAKSTEQKSFSLKYEFLEEWIQKAKEQGKGFLLPIRFENACKNKDYVVLSMDDFLTFWLLSMKYLEEN